MTQNDANDANLRHMTQNDAYSVPLDAKVTKILGVDASGLYNYSLQQPMPTGMYIRRESTDQFRPQIREMFELQYAYMDYLNDVHGRKILHKKNTGKERYIACYKIDGIDETNNIATEILGCWIHGHRDESCWLTRKITCEKWHKRAKQEQEKIKQRLKHLQVLKYKTEFVYECQLRNLYHRDKQFKDYVDRMRPAFYRKHRKECTEEDIINGVRSGLLFGMIECDLDLPNEWPPELANQHKDDDIKTYFNQFPVIFGQGCITKEHVSEYMTQYCNRQSINIEKPRKMLISSNSARGVLFTSPYLKQLLEFGFKASNISLVIEWQSSRPFKKLMEDYCQIRRDADLDPDKSILGATAKLLSNSSYGSLLLNESSFTTISFEKGKQNASKKVNDRSFLKLSTISETQQLYEVESVKKTIKYTMPVQLAHFVLCYAKQRMNEFVYDFLKKYLKKGSYTELLMDTDSLYLALLGELEDCIKPSMLPLYNHQIYGFCNHDEIIVDRNRFFIRKCCLKHQQWDERLSGTFHNEFQGHLVLAFCPKCYWAESWDDGTTKCSAKGVQKHLLATDGSDYKIVFREQIQIKKTNKGFIVKPTGIYTYEQSKNALSLSYFKRLLGPDGSTTYPLNIPVIPKKIKPRIIMPNDAGSD